MIKEIVPVMLLGLGGLLVGGVYSVWKTAKLMAVVLGLCAVVAIGGAVAWFMS